jgi:hypothetical protein
MPSIYAKLWMALESMKVCFDGDSHLANLDRQDPAEGGSDPVQDFILLITGTYVRRMLIR